MTESEQNKIFALLDKIDPAQCGPQTMKEHATEVKRLLTKLGLEPQSLGPSVAEEIGGKLDGLAEKVTNLGNQLAAVERALSSEDGEPQLRRRARA